MEKFELKQKVEEPKKSEQNFYKTPEPNKPKINKDIVVKQSAQVAGASRNHLNNQHSSGKKYDEVQRTNDPTINTFHSVAQPNEDQSEGYCKRLHNNRKQTGSICGGLLLMLVSGLHIGWGIWRTHGWSTHSANMSLLIFSIMTWPIFAICGSLIGSALIIVLRKDIIYYITAGTMAVANVIYIIWYNHYAAIVCGRILTSLAHGTLFITLVTQAGENGSRGVRATIFSTINCIQYAAIFMSVQINAILAGDFSSERIIGGLALAFVLASVICTITLNIETVPHLLWKNERLIAMDNMKRLRDVTIESPQMTREMAEMETMVLQDKQDNRNVFVDGNVKPLLLILIIRLMAALTNNFLLNIILIGSCELILNEPEYASSMIIAARLAMSVVQIFYADVVPRKIQIFVSAALAGVLLIGLGVILNVVTITSSINYFVPSLFAMHFQVLCGLGIEQMANVYLSEAFSTAKKPWSLSFVVGIEHVFHLFMIGMAFTSVSSAGLYALLFVSGGFLIFMGAVLMFLLPETKGMTLKEARDAFRKNEIFNLF
ncbi:solute carrier family 2, facilitated glucose transporter member 7-like [Bradysia coprophila]|uniref:solute carrier family 2, facilitated glucose transporter member 7-like n=1 Tax=Bradysia coprophila TaxID=38358 RepID=UPI00187DCE94|nr:solute carrier family 2, facilitated glucose transporter member 7-like [Bradysia coprophila]